MSSVPGYDRLFGDPDVLPVDDARSVYSPAAYLADLLELAGEELRHRRPDLAEVPLDGHDSYAELPYLTIVSEVLAGQVAEPGGDAFDTLAALRYPFLAPFSLGRERLRQALRELGVEPVELYRRFATRIDADVVAREYLGLAPADVTMVTTVLGDGPELRDCYHLDPADPDGFARLAETDLFCRAASLTGADLRQLLWGALGVTERSAASAFFVHQGAPVALDEAGQRLVGDGGSAVPPAWFDRVNRFVRLARRTGLSFVDLDLVLRSCCGNRIDQAALRVLAVVTWLQRTCDLPVDVVVSLVAPLSVLGVGDGDVPADPYNRIFNVPFVALGGGVVPGPGPLPAPYAGLPSLTCAGDVLAPANADYRRRVATAVGLVEADLTAVVGRYRDRDEAMPRLFGRPEPDLADLSLLYRVGRLTAVLGVGVDDLFQLLTALGSDPSLQRYTAFPVLIDTGVQGLDYLGVLGGGDIDSGLWLIQTLVAVARWLQATGMSVAELLEIQGVPTAEPDLTVLDGIRQQLTPGPTATIFQSA
ncbi:MAG TPA: Tc toxin subunit A, partial [Actinoplanes sp.]